MATNEVPEVHTYGVANSGSRASQFTAGDLIVLVRGRGGDLTEEAFNFACELARARSVLATEQDRSAQLMVDLAAAKAKIPPKRGASLMGRGYVRFVSGALWVLNNRERGLGEFGFRFPGWDELFRTYNVCVVEHGTDEHGEWWAVENFPAQTLEGGAA